MNRMDAILACNALSRECDKHEHCVDCPVYLENNEEYDCLITYINEIRWDREVFTRLANDEISKACAEEKCKNEQESFASGDKLSPVESRLSDNVNHPKHYLKGGLECIQVIKAQLTPEQYEGYLYGNVIKYMWRWKEKNGLEDLRKAAHYLMWLQEEVKKNG